MRAISPLTALDQPRTAVIKLGGAALPHKEAALEDLRALREAGLQPVLVHGGGPVISEWLARIGKQAILNYSYNQATKRRLLAPRRHPLPLQRTQKTATSGA